MHRPPSSRQHGKSLAHLQIQLHLKSLIPSLQFEKRIENRIGDLVWEEKKIVFEIQCSHLSLEEAKRRSHDYKAMGYVSVWLLHDRRFNRRFPTPAEDYLRQTTTTFYTDGRRFYDQFDLKTPRLYVDLAMPQKKIPHPLFSRTWPLSFQGDLYHAAETHDLSHLKHRPRPTRWKSVYKFLLMRLLEVCDSCR